MDKYQIHFCLVSQQATPNITPAIDKDFKPDEVILITPRQYRDNADGISAVLKQHGIICQYVSIEDQWDIRDLRQQLAQLLSDYSDRSVVLNATCGSKPMSIAAYEVFREAGRPIFYVHPETDHLLWLSPTDRDSFDLQDRVKLHEFFTAYGAQIEEGQLPQSREIKQLGENMLLQHHRYHKAFPALNWLAASASNSLTSDPIPTSRVPPYLDLLIAEFSDAKLLEEKNGRLIFPDSISRDMVNGLWLDQHIQRMVTSAKSSLKIQDIAANIRLTRLTERNDPVHNELDVAFLHNNRLFVIECKTRHFSNRKQQQNDFNDMFYKIDSLKKRFGGKTATAMLVSYLDIPAANKRRAADLEITLCDGNKLQNFVTHLRNWINDEFSLRE